LSFVNILVVTPFALTETGGVSTSVKMLCREFTEMGHDTTILIPGDTIRFVLDSEYFHSPVYRAYLRIPRIQRTPIRGALAFCAYFPATLLMLRRFLTQHNIQVVSLNYPAPWNLYFAALRPFSRWKLVVTFHGNDAHDLPTAAWIDRSIIRLIVARADHVTAVSKSLVEAVQRCFPKEEFTSSVVHTGTPRPPHLAVDRPGQQNHADYILTIGHLIHRKGIDLVVKALELLTPHGVDVKLVVVGEGPERSRLEQLVEQLGLTRRVEFLGDQPHEVVFRLLHSSSFFVLASRAEGLPLVILEAMASRVAVVATNVDGVPEVVEDGVTGILVEPENVSALANALLRLCRDEPFRRALAQAGHERVCRDFTWDSIAAKYIRVFQGVLESAPS
jgi:glycosyltransferase involved in cell wall biosynthesis